MINKLKIINDPVHGFIRIPHEILFDVIEHPYFQRLRRISQTGLLHLTFPGATHTRFHHAIGAMHLMLTAIETLRQKGTIISLEEEKAALLAILLHDIGHGPFSHALENTLIKGCHHETLTLYLMRELNEAFSGQLSLAIEMFLGHYPRAFFYQLISSQLDVDRLDYLKRDSFFTGVSEGNINTQRIISMMNVHQNELVIDAKGIYSIENFLTARMLMYWQVYYHKTSSLTEFILVKIIETAKQLHREGHPLLMPEKVKYFLSRKQGQITPQDLEKYTQIDDNDILQAIKEWQNDDHFVLSYWCKCLINRHLPKILVSSTPFSEKQISDKIEQTNLALGIANGEKLVQTLNRSLLPYSTDKQPIYLLQKNKSILRLDQSEDNLLSGLIGHETQRYFLAFPG